MSGPGPDDRDGVSVVTATVGRRDALLAKLDALRAQTLEPSRWEWLVAFDGPQDALERELRSAAGAAIELRTVTTERRGPGPARDAAARLARFSVLLLSDDDCLPEPEALERHLEAQRLPSVAVGTVVFAAGDEETTSEPPGRPGWWHLAGANTSLPSEAFRAIGGFGTATEGYGGEDLWLGWRLHRAGLPFRAAPQARVRHLGPDPRRSMDGRKAFEAGVNAVRLARREGALAWRLGVHPALLLAKALVLAVPWPGVGAARWAYEREYARGARHAWARRDAAAATASGAREDER